MIGVGTQSQVQVTSMADGAADIIIGAARYGDNSRPLGSSYVVFGRP